METQSQILAEFVAKLKFEDIPTQVIERVKLHVLDILGIGLAASNMAYAKMIAETVRAWGGPAECTVMNYGFRLPVPSAVLANASFTHGLDYDDPHAESVTHASTCVVPTALGVGEALEIDGKTMLTAAVAGYETIARIGLAAPGGFHHRGYHATPICGTFASGVVTAKMMGLDAESLTNTLGVCGSQAAGIQAFLDDGSWTKRFHAGWASHSGVIAAQLAAHGFHGPKTVLEGRYGLLATHLGRDAFDAGRISRGLGDQWETVRISFKPYPVCHFSHACMDAALALRKTHQFRPEDIVEGEALVPETIIPIVCEPLADKQSPDTTYAARFSLPFCVATCLVHGGAHLDHFQNEALQNREVLDVASKIRFRAEPWPNFPSYFSGGLRLTLGDGRTVEHREAINRGNPDNPMQPDEIEQKFQNNAGRTLPQKRCDEIIKTVFDLEKIPRVGKLAALCVNS